MAARAGSLERQVLGTGNGGGGGQIITSALAAGLARGYAVANTDMGSSSGIGGNDWGFGIGHPELQKDWEYRATDGMTVQGKLITTAYYGQKPKLSYFQGCSTGGLQGWQQAQRMPDAYDGIVSGDPSPDIPNEHLNRVWGEWQNLQSVDATIPKEKMAMVTRSVIAMCDAKDGVKDSIIADPRRCNFDPMSLVCKAGDGPDCLTPRQVQTLKAIYDGPRNPRTGARIAFGPEPGAESAVDLHWAEKVGPKGEVILSGRTAQWSKTYVANHPDGVGIDWDKDVEAIDAELTKDMNNSDPHLGQFQKHGKLIMYQGWEDGLVPAMDNVEFYEQIAKANGGIKKTQNWTRLFMVPGMGHCAGGVGTDQFDPLAALEGWVEHGLAPERIIATRVARGELTALSRPLCAYPAEAVYAGSGDTNDAANFVCKAPAK